MPPKKTRMMTAEDKALMRTRALRQFKMLVYLVIANKPWLDDVADRELGDDYKHNVAILKRKGKGVKSHITLGEKALLSKPIQYRSEEEKIHLDTILGGIKCFKKFPREVKRQLAGVSYFKYYGPDRVIVRQNHVAHALYFILSGEVNITTLEYESIFKTWNSKDMGNKTAGDMFGEVSLLHNIPRTATVTTITACELLCLMKEDFEMVLRDSVQAMWDEIERCMATIPYFDDLNQLQARECVILSHTTTYTPPQIVFGDGLGQKMYVYFILEGNCRLLQHLMVETSIKEGRKTYKLYDYVEDDVQSRADSEEEEFHSLAERSTMLSSETLLTRATQCTTETSEHAVGKLKPQRKSVAVPKPTYPPNVEVHYMQVCIMKPGDCFNVGENLQNRRVIALTNVKCLLIPRYWIMSHNQTNVWTQVRNFLNNRIPSTNQLFQEFKNHKRWLKYRKQVSDDVFAKRHIPVNTTIHDVPIVTRLTEWLPE